MELLLDDTCQLLFPSDIINGSLLINASNQASSYVNDPIIRIIGYTLIWKNKCKTETEEYSLFYEDKPIIYREDKNLSSTDISTISSKMYTFYLTLPDNLPTSFEVPFGHTRYKISAYYNGITVFKFFSVGQKIELKKCNKIIEKKTNYNAPLFCCFHSIIKASFKIDHTPCVPGEIIFLDAFITNNSWEDIIFTKAFIVQIVKYWKDHTIFPIKYSRVISEITRGIITSGSSQVWIKQPLALPAVIPTTRLRQNPFNFFEIEYKLKIRITLQNSKKKTLLTKKIFVGNKDERYKKLQEPLNKFESINFSVEDCFMSKHENIDFIPKYLVRKI
ncbi:arrestin domain-containing protein 17-like [Daktulosphaira vitifoliae]|uniref:arrestin domain-containing protein 17-like n=1 Tax=Daktulosphaira vitifoliae TaxID=58002 RepID=UPI0021A9FA8B|nr:arrestin domain-containing protein 17-like [Daktulosphaira vitifoliae]